MISRGATRFSVNLKRAPGALSLETPDAVILAQSLLTEFREHHPEVFEDAIAFVGQPAGWPPEAVAPYSRHLGLLCLPGRLMPKSQSAFLHVRDRGRDEKATRTGSGRRHRLVHDGLDDRRGPLTEEPASGRHARLPADRRATCRPGPGRAAPRRALMEALTADGGPDFLLLACRWAKEAQFSGVSRRIMDLRESCEECFLPIVATAWTWLLDLEIPQMVAAPGGWGEDFHAVLAEVADLLSDRCPHLVVLTGGGSRMPFAGRLCREVFPTQR